MFMTGNEITYRKKRTEIPNRLDLEREQAREREKRTEKGPKKLYIYIYVLCIIRSLR